MSTTPTATKIAELTESVEKLEGVLKKLRAERKETRAELSMVKAKAELWECRAKKNGKTVKHLKAQSNNIIEGN